MSFENFKISIADVIKLGGFIIALVIQYYTFKMEVREQFLASNFHNQNTDSHFAKLDASDKLQEQKLNVHDIKLAKIFTLLYRDADKPKETKIETEE
ncbi:MAG: hypothetical protein L6Q66_08385 [Bacteroidia bacterium]|nr:hypothetical protein [Bacteroidia bacterium]